MGDHVLLEVSEAIAVITMNRPAQRNPLSAQMREELAAAIYCVRDDADVKAVVLTGAGTAFCAGGDLTQLQDPLQTGMVFRERMRRLHRWFPELVNLEKPVIAAVQGAAYGAGMNLALAADFVIATPTTTFCAVFGRIGFVPDMGGMYLLPRIIGLQRAKELVFSARTIGAEEALTLGIVYRLFPEEQLVSQAKQLARRLLNGSIAAIGMAKSIMNQSFHLDAHAMAEMEAYAQTVARETSYHREAVAAFASRKPSRFDWDRS